MTAAVETMAYAGEVPWHGLGANVDPKISADEFMIEAGLDWTVEKHPMFYQKEDGGEMFVAEDRYALVRNTDGKMYGVCSDNWTPVQNQVIFDMMKDYAAAGGITLETAGSLREGRIVWGLAKLNHTFEVSKGDLVNGYLLITTPHQVGTCTTVRTTTVRVVCQNTLMAAENNSTVNYKQNHVNGEFDVAAAREAIGEAHEQLLVAERRAKTLKKLKISMADAAKNAIIPVMFPKLVLAAEGDGPSLDEVMMTPDNQPKHLQQILDSYQNAPGNDNKTGWGALNAVTHWCDHVAGRNPNSRMMRGWMGDFSRKKVAVEHKLLQLAA